MNENEIGTIIIDTAINIHKKLGPGLLESVYEKALLHSLEKQGINVEKQFPVTIEYGGIIFYEGFHAGIIVEDKVIIELKSLEKLSDIHKKQFLTYLKLSKLKLGYLINFNEKLLKDGIVRIINGKIED